MLCLVVGVIGPVEEAVGGEMLAALFVNQRKKSLGKCNHIFLLLSQVFDISDLTEQIVVHPDPPERIGGDIVHPKLDGGIVSGQIKRLANYILISEYREDSLHLCVHITDPNEAVTLDSVPKILLHIEVNGISGGLPDLIKSFVGAFEIALVFKVAEIEENAGFVPFLGEGNILYLQLCDAYIV